MSGTGVGPGDCQALSRECMDRASWLGPPTMLLMRAAAACLFCMQTVVAVPLVRTADGLTMFAFRRGSHLSKLPTGSSGHGTSGRADPPLVPGFLPPRTGPLGVYVYCFGLVNGGVEHTFSQSRRISQHCTAYTASTDSKLNSICPQQ